MTIFKKIKLLVLLGITIVATSSAFAFVHNIVSYPQDQMSITYTKAKNLKVLSLSHNTGHTKWYIHFSMPHPVIAAYTLQIKTLPNNTAFNCTVMVTPTGSISEAHSQNPGYLQCKAQDGQTIVVMIAPKKS